MCGRKTKTRYLFNNTDKKVYMNRKCKYVLIIPLKHIFIWHNPLGESDYPTEATLNHKTFPSFSFSLLYLLKKIFFCLFYTCILLFLCVCVCQIKAVLCLLPSGNTFFLYDAVSFCHFHFNVNYEVILFPWEGNFPAVPKLWRLLWERASFQKEVLLPGPRVLLLLFPYSWFFISHVCHLIDKMVTSCWRVRSVFVYQTHGDSTLWGLATLLFSPLI